MEERRHKPLQLLYLQLKRSSPSRWSGLCRIETPYNTADAAIRLLLLTPLHVNSRIELLPQGHWKASFSWAYLLTFWRTKDANAEVRWVLFLLASSPHDQTT